MILTKSESDLFFKLYKTLLAYENKGDLSKPTKIDDYIIARNYLFDHLEIFDRFIKNNPAKFSKNELDIISNWKNKYIKGDFVFFRQQKLQAIFIENIGDKDLAYKVLGLTDSPKDMVGIEGAFLRDIVLLPFGNKIIWDGLFYMGPILGTNYLRSYNELYKELKSDNKIISEL